MYRLLRRLVVRPYALERASSRWCFFCSRKTFTSQHCRLAFSDQFFPIYRYLLSLSGLTEGIAT